jgi:hypothetical protein
LISQRLCNLFGASGAGFTSSLGNALGFVVKEISAEGAIASSTRLDSSPAPAPRLGLSRLL